VDDASLASAKALAPQINLLVPPAGPIPGQPASGQLILGLWVKPRPALRLVSQFRKGLEKFPLADRRQVERWRNWETLLSPLAACERASVTATRSPSAFLLRLQECD
jgi:hypothetical protein